MVADFVGDCSKGQVQPADMVKRIAIRRVIVIIKALPCFILDHAMIV